MKTFRSLFILLLAALGAMCFASLGRGAEEKNDDSKAAAAAVTASDSWDAIKNCTYEQRADFAAGLAHMTERMDAAISRLKAKRATLPQTSVKDWDFAMKELVDAHSDLRFQVDGLDKATPETWAEVKDKLAQAWQRTKDAFDKVRTSTTT